MAAVVVPASALAAGAWWWDGSVQRGQAEVRSRWALEEAIKRNLAPQEVAPDWYTLEAALGSAIKRDPAGELSVLAQRASCEVRVKTWPTFVSSRMAAVSGEVEWSRRRWPVLDAFLRLRATSLLMCRWTMRRGRARDSSSPGRSYSGMANLVSQMTSRALLTHDSIRVPVFRCARAQTCKQVFTI